MAIENLHLDIIEEITLNDDTKYYELANVDLNTYAEYAAEHNLIKEVRILKINIPHSSRVERVERYVAAQYDMPTFNMKEWIVWQKPPEIEEELRLALEDNNVS